MNKKRSRSEHGSRKMRKNLSKTKRRPRSNKKGALKGIRNNKTKVNKRRIVQRGGNKKYDDLVTAVMIGIVDDVSRILQKGDVADFHNYRPENNTVLYTACRSPTPNLGMVQLLLTWGFEPNIPNGHNGHNGSYPQHGVVAAAKYIIGDGILYPHQNTEELNSLETILKALKQSHADMSLKNKLQYTAYDEYSIGFIDVPGTPPLPSIESRIAVIDHDLSVRIRDLLRPPPGPPPPGYGAPPPGYGAPPPGYGAPPPGYGAPPPGYSPPQPGYGAPPPGYGAPPPGYGAPPPGPPPPPREVAFYPNFYEIFKDMSICQDISPKTDYYDTVKSANTTFKYKDKIYYLTDSFQKRVQTKIMEGMQQSEVNYHIGNVVVVDELSDKFMFYIKLGNVKKCEGYVSFTVGGRCWVQDAPFIFKSVNLR